MFLLGLEFILTVFRDDDIGFHVPLGTRIHSRHECFATDRTRDSVVGLFLVGQLVAVIELLFSCRGREGSGRNGYVGLCYQCCTHLAISIPTYVHMYIYIIYAVPCLSYF